MSSPHPAVPFVRRLFLACIGTGVALLGACGQDRDPRPNGGPVLGERSQELVAATAYYVGASTMPAKQLALTFDDGPGPRTSELSTYLKEQNIRATFFVNGACIQTTALPNDSCGTPLPGAAAVLAQLAADGHLVANHSTTHRDITTVPMNQRVQELSDTDALITLHGKTPWNRSLFRAPFGSWSAAVHGTLSTSAMSHYVGPIYWDIGGDSERYPNAAADWACFQGELRNQDGSLVHSAPGDPIPDGYATTQECGAAYRAEINAIGQGIVLMHDPYGWAQGSTVDMVKYLVPLLKADGYTFVRADEVARIAADFPACGGAGCATYSGPGANQCTSCTAGRYLSGGACLPCTTCAPGTHASAACTPTADTVCTPCSACAPGSYASAACTATTDTVCAACHASCATCSGPTASDCGTCPSGFFLGGGACQACAVCPAGTHTASACAADANTICTPCAPGTFTSSPGATSCTSCGSCDDGDPCTDDTCSTTTGCTHAPIPGCGGSSGSSGASGASEAPGAAPSPSVVIDDGAASNNGVRDDDGCNAGRSASVPSASPAIALAALALLRRRRKSCVGR